MDKKIAKITTTQIRQIFGICTQIGVNLNDADTRKEMVANWTEGKKTSFSELDCFDADTIIKYLQKMQSKPQINKNLGANSKELDIWRKRCMAAVGGYFKNCGNPQHNNQKYIISTIERACGMDCQFNKMTKAQLRRIYSEFCEKQKIKRATPPSPPNKPLVILINNNGDQKQRIEN